MVMDTVPDEFSQLILSIYQDATAERPWKDFCHHFSNAIGRDNFSLIIHSPSEHSNGFILHSGGDPYWIKRYEEYFYAIDPFVDLPPNEVICLSDFVPSAELESSEYYRQFMVPIDLLDVMGADCCNTNGDVMLKVRVCRLANEAPFCDAEKALLLQLLPHMDRANRIHRGSMIFNTTSNFVNDILDNLNTALITVDDSMKILTTNPIAESLFEWCDVIVRKKGMLSMGNRQYQRMLDLALESIRSACHQGDAGAVRGFSLNDSAAGQLACVIKPAPQPEQTHSPLVFMILISNTETRTRVDPQILAQLYGFTEAESRLAVLLSNGLSAGEAAETLQVSISTVRTQLRGLLTKSGVSRQSDLMWLMWQSAI